MLTFTNALRTLDKAEVLAVKNGQNSTFYVNFILRKMIFNNYF